MKNEIALTRNKDTFFTKTGKETVIKATVTKNVPR